MRTSRLVAFGGLCLSFVWVLAGGCSSSSKEPSSYTTGGTSSAGSAGKPSDPTVVTTDASDPDAGKADTVDPRCGVAMGSATCLPDDPNACVAYDPNESLGGAGGQGGQNGQNELGGAPNDPTPVNSGGAGAESAAGFGGAAGLGGQDGEGGEPPQRPSAYACQVTRQNNQLVRQCTLAGKGQGSMPCFSGADCAPGFACVTEQDGGRCLPYCCAPETACTSGTYCAERPLRKALADTSNVEPPRVPVCVPTDGCSLEDPYPCPSDGRCRCKGETACMVVRNDGSTTCVTPGSGTEGQPCPCAWNHVCSAATNTCVKICRTDEPSKSGCGTQKCQASSELPKNFGVCVGPLK